MLFETERTQSQGSPLDQSCLSKGKSKSKQDYFEDGDEMKTREMVLEVVNSIEHLQKHEGAEEGRMEFAVLDLIRIHEVHWRSSQHLGS